MALLQRNAPQPDPVSVAALEAELAEANAEAAKKREALTARLAAAKREKDERQERERVESLSAEQRAALKTYGEALATVEAESAVVLERLAEASAAYSRAVAAGEVGRIAYLVLEKMKTLPGLSSTWSARGRSSMAGVALPTGAAIRDRAQELLPGWRDRQGTDTILAVFNPPR